MEDKLRLAILDMYEGTRNLGMENIQDIVRNFSGEIAYEIFDVRSHIQVPDLSFDLYIFSGGPGNPLVGDESWLQPFHDLIEDIWQYNLRGEASKKYCFFICHSFQMACHHFGFGKIVRRHEKSFGTFPVFKTKAGKEEWLFRELGDPFWVADFREFQVIDPNPSRMAGMGAKLLLIERERDRPELKRAMMAVRFSDEMIGTQFHPEADPVGMRSYFSEPERIEAVLDEYGEERYLSMVEDLKDPAKIKRTHAMILPLFLHKSIRLLRENSLVLV
ncbi:MAG: GMP synthase [Lewinellaceae bacterium]|nr:GMP synthase [Saprospiraceae bacterium]MCB9338205.1 GMP synthase [Lewinellaceae bacterium]